MKVLKHLSIYLSIYLHAQKSNYFFLLICRDMHQHYFSSRNPNRPSGSLGNPSSWAIQLWAKVHPRYCSSSHLPRPQMLQNHGSGEVTLQQAPWETSDALLPSPFCLQVWRAAFLHKWFSILSDCTREDRQKDGSEWRTAAL